MNNSSRKAAKDAWDSLIELNNKKLNFLKLNIVKVVK